MNRLIALLALAGCANSSADMDQIAADYADLVSATYADSITTAETMNDALQALVDNPSEANLAAAKQAWLDAREPYLETEVYRFYDGPIDNPTDGPEGLLNAWPLDENYIDYVTDNDSAGIINDTEQEISAEALEGLNEAGGEKNIATGYHAVEFLLWGQDLSTSGPGARPYTDYVTDGSGTAANPDRRGEYLLIVGDMIVDHLQQVADQWADGADYRTDFLADSDAAIEKAMTGMIILSGFETGGERLQAALDSGDQEDEHSCFSDNTHRDMIQDIQGVKNVWEIVMPALDAADSELAARITAEIDESLSFANALNTPFDQEIVPGAEGNARVQALIDALRTQEASLQEAFTVLGFSVTIPE